MHGFVRNEIPEDKVRREDETPVERQVPACRAVAPLRALTHHVDAVRSLAKASRNDFHMSFYRTASFASQPMLKTARNGGTRARSLRHDDFSIHEAHRVSCSPRSRPLDANSRRLATEEYFTGNTTPRGAKTAEAFGAVDLLEKPAFVGGEKRRHLLFVARYRLHNVDTSRSYAHAELTGGLGLNDAVVDHSATKPDPVLSRGLHGFTQHHQPWPARSLQASGKAGLDRHDQSRAARTADSRIRRASTARRAFDRRSSCSNRPR